MIGRRLEFRLLGAFEVLVDDRPVRAGQPKQRALLALLALRRKTPVSISEIVDALWDETPPRRARNQIQVYVMGLRRVLAGAGAPRDLIATHPVGYLLDVPASAVDLAVFESAVDNGRRLASAGRPGAANEAMQGALALWRGPALGGVPGAFFERIATRLEEQRVAVLEQQARLQLSLGGHVEVVGHLRAAVAANPLHEGLRYGLMVALYRCGRLAEALAAYREGRNLTVAELGIEPGPELRGLERRILRGEPP